MAANQVQLKRREELSTTWSWLEREHTLAYILLAPAFLLLVVFILYPFLYGIYLSMADIQIDQHSGTFVGLGNFIAILNSTIFQRTIFNTFVYTIIASIIKFALGIWLSLLLHQEFRFKALARASMLLPWIVPTVLSTIAWMRVVRFCLSISVYYY